MVHPEEVTEAPVPSAEHAANDGPLVWSPARASRAHYVANITAAIALLAILAMGIAYANAGMP